MTPSTNPASPADAGAGAATDRSAVSSAPIHLVHGRSRLALHQLADGDPGTHPLLLLHGLGERSATSVPGVASTWSGPVWALDFTGHGESTIPTGGGYTAEVLMADVDAALAHLGPATLLGRGLGSYVALLAAGGRSTTVRGAVLTDGPGLVGGGIRPASAYIAPSPPGATGPPDPLALAELSRDVRPPDYAVQFVRLAVERSPLDEPIAVCTMVRPEWLSAVVDQPGVVDTTVDRALATFQEA